MSTIQIALAKGDGIGPEITDAAVKLLDAAGATKHVEFTPVDMGLHVMESGRTSGMTQHAVDTVESCGILFKGPMGTPSGGGGKSVNVTARKMWGAFANHRHFITLPGVETVFSKAGIPINLHVVRENVEDTYGGIEHRLTSDVIECKRLISAPGSDQVHTFAFETARRLGMKEIHCAHKANIMKLTDGMFLGRFHEIGKKYPDIEKKDVIIDALCMHLVRWPQEFNMVVLPNLQGDIVSDLAAGLVGGLGFAPSANIGNSVSIFEAVHGTAPDIAGKGIANPTALMLSSLMMLRHIGLVQTAATIENALLYTLESGVRTGDFGDTDKPALNTMEYTDAIIGNLGKEPSTVAVTKAPGPDSPREMKLTKPTEHNMLRTYKIDDVVEQGCDIYIDAFMQPKPLADQLVEIAEGTPFELTMMSNRGTQVWPTGSVFTECVDYYRVRFEVRKGVDAKTLTQTDAVKLFSKVADKFTVTDYQPIRMYDGKPGYSLAQGQ